MTDKVKRSYRSDLRTAQAQQTRRTLVAAAARLFVEQGYGATTIDAVAEAAGVSRKTVFTAVGGKLDLLKLAVDWAVAGDDDDVAVADRDEIGRALAAHDPEELLRRCARVMAGVNERVGDLVRVLEVAAGVDAEAETLLAAVGEQRLADARLVARRLRALGLLTGRTAYEEAVDLIFLTTDPHPYDVLVRQRGWSPTRYARWLGDWLVGQLVPG
ncbi:TetR family transcriptional regulator [Mycolicibacterium litorale]|uniref:TetR family transcriptional regulator n=1 Tax=Mycolicibacterium litorale TaxID=758802 RepID=A0A6S6P9J5_9MYCO|nr:TetR/AcrR family transcriptional regulator [Mycolicibacterium litorale]BCI53370.1 TetR family transcriptional regulator [Mycolicibacterium litorale]